MDLGAHFHKCDFQVHTPRDINWKGKGAVTEDERKQYASEFVAACRTKGLDAVAITDHHDIAFFRYIRSAAQAETGPGGEPLSSEEQLTVFPGMELTLAVPCQALLLLDADFPVELLSQVVQALSITPAPDADAHNAPTHRLEHIKSLGDLYSELNKREFLRNRFIVFPHVGETGTFTLLRSGFASHYKTMPCVGGFVDGSVNQHGKGNRDIVNGKNKDYGNKAIAVFQTSDNRNRDFSLLGSYATWVKWSQPTAEALRQACLSRHSRISHSVPKLPSARMTRLEVSNSKFLGPVVLDLNPQYAAIIGGRGTGKSTLLEYLRWALCDQPPSDTGGGELADFQKRRQALIENTLIPLGAAVDVSFLVDEVQHVVRRKASGELSLKIAEGPLQACTEDNVRDLLPVRAYSQKQLSAVGARLEELRRFVHAPIRTDLAALEEKIAQSRSDLRLCFDRLLRFRSLKSELSAHELERTSLSERLEKLRATLKGLSETDRTIIARKSGYDAEERVIAALERDAQAARTALSSAAQVLMRVPTKVDLPAAGENAATLKAAVAAFDAWSKAAGTSLGSISDALEPPTEAKALGAFFSGLETWRAQRTKYQAEYDAARKRAAAHEETLRQVTALESRLKEINDSSDAKAEQLQQLATPEADFAQLRSARTMLLTKRADLLEGQCAKLSATPSTRLRATVRRAADVGSVGDHLKQLLRGTRARADRIDSLLKTVAESASPLEAWDAALDELWQLAWTKVEDEATTILPAVPRLDAAGFTTKEKMGVAKQLQPPAWLDVLLLDLSDLPVFEYKLREGDFIAFQDASPGQQATALLSILLLQDGPPLLIDQPEDDLNMKIITEVVETLWQAKSHRQLVFASHNANLVVNGDAELVVCCDYRTSSTESGGKIKAAGAIDIPAIRSEITEVMEGGEDAFKLRQQKYGF